MAEEDEVRAAAYRLQWAARIRNKRLAELALAGDPVAKAALEEKYAATLTGQAVPLLWENV